MSFSKLRGRIREKYDTQEAFSAAMSMSPTTLSKKLQGQTDWTKQEMERAARLLDIHLLDIPAYFFSG